MNIIKDKKLYSFLDSSPITSNQPYIERLLAEIKKELETTGDRDWLVDTETNLTNPISKIETTSRQVAVALASMGFQPGDVLQTGYSSCLDFYWPVFGAWLCGGTVSLGDPNLSETNIKKQLEETKAKVLVSSIDYLDKYYKVIQELKLQGKNVKYFILDAGEQDTLPLGVESFQTLMRVQETQKMPLLLDFTPDRESIIMWSSGSSGTPKGILHSQKNLLNLYFGHDLKPKTIISSALMFHISSFTFNLTLGILKGTICYIMKEKCFSGENLLKVAEKIQPEHVFCGVSQYIQVSNTKTNGYNLNGVKNITPLGGAVSPGCSEKVLSLLGSQATLVEMYGSTEVMFVSKHEVKDIEFGLLGSLAAGVEICIQDINTGERLDPGKEGKIMVKTNTMMMRYLNREKETNEFFDSDGFGFTGDIGYYDNFGKIFFSYRMREVLKVDNYWFGPAEIENLLEKEPTIDEACVWGEYDPNTGNDQVHELKNEGMSACFN